VRITGGIAKGRVITCPDGLDVRPTGSKIRQALFNILVNKVPGARFLDLFAGSGLMGIEALSRGAASLVAVEQSRQQAKVVESNLNKVGLGGAVICGDVRKVLPSLPERSYDIIFADPPYRSTSSVNLPERVDKLDLLADDGVLVIEHARALILPDQTDRLVQSDFREYGQTAISFYRQKKA
jgi:16S rRNA (guanine966-N2)-methyltransferase